MQMTFSEEGAGRNSYSQDVRIHIIMKFPSFARAALRELTGLTGCHQGTAALHTLSRPMHVHTYTYRHARKLGSETLRAGSTYKKVSTDVYTTPTRRDGSWRRGSDPGAEIDSHQHGAPDGSDAHLVFGESALSLSLSLRTEPRLGVGVWDPQPHTHGHAHASRDVSDLRVMHSETESDATRKNR